MKRGISLVIFGILVIGTVLLVLYVSDSKLHQTRQNASEAHWIVFANAPIMYPSLPSEGADNIYAPDVHKEKNIWKMWYGGQDAQGHDGIHYATSTDGITWQKYGVVLNNLNSYGGHPILDNDPSVVLVNGIYYMYFTENTDRDRINLATSIDGIHWDRKGVVLDLTPNEWGTKWTSRPSVIYENGIFKLWYDSLDPNPSALLGVGYATSTDGIHFTKSFANPVLTNTIGAVDVKHVGDEYIMVYQGPNNSPVYWATSPDETHFTSKGPLFQLTSTSYDAHGDVTPDIYIDELGNWTRTYFGGATDTCWCKNRIMMAYSDQFPLAGQKQVVIQGYKLIHIGDYPSLIAHQPVLLNQKINSMDNPYFLYTTFYPGETYIVSVPHVAGYTIGYTLCYNRIDCHNDPPVQSNSARISLDKAQDGGFVDLWWHYTLTSLPTISSAPVLQYPFGDVNHDGQLDFQDVRVLINCFNIAVSTPRANCPHPQWADLNQDGKVNGIDYNILLRSLSR